MKIGDQYIIKDDCEYFGPTYQGSTVKIVTVSGPNDDCLEVEAYDGNVFMCAKSMLVTIEEYYDKKFEDFGLTNFIEDTEMSVEVPCHHPNKYVNHISPNLSFTVCPDCGKEVE